MSIVLIEFDTPDEPEPQADHGQETNVDADPTTQDSTNESK